MAQTTFTLSSGQKIPSIGLGTWQSATGEVARAVEHALRNGYRHIDCAWAYGNEAEVGEGIKNSGVPREEIFVTSKLFELHHRPENVQLAIEDTLKNLGLQYLDLYLMHWNISIQVDAPDGVLPNRQHIIKTASGKKTLDVALSDDVSPTWTAMEKLVDQGLAKAIGVSNFNINRLKRLLASDIRIKPVVDQVELSIQCPQQELVQWLKRQNILPCAFSPLGGTGGSHLREHKVVKAIADKHSVQGATILISWLLKRGIIPLPKSVTPSRIDGNLKSINLSADEFEEIERLASSHPPQRVCDQSNSFEPYYDIYQETNPDFSDKAIYAKEM